MPAAAVIPAPIAYTKVVAVKKLVVGFLLEGRNCPPREVQLASLVPPATNRATISLVALGTGSFTLRKIECSKQANCLE